ncbi:MAG: transaldolase family protein [Oscillospiraceae bacterium]|nr:transaldolase family protein [Oscillospiraceae bacterium]
MKNYLQWLAEDTATVWWHDSADAEELIKAMDDGAVGVTTNPVLVSQILESKRDIISANVVDISIAKDGDEKAEAIIKAVTLDIAKELLPVYKKTRGRNGYVCAQVNPNKAANTDYMIENALRLHNWAENISVKLPVTNAGLDAIEECVALGLNVTATMSFTVPQALAAAERYEKGYARAGKVGKKPNTFNTVIMVGRLDDYLRDVAHDRRAGIEENDIICAGTAVMKRAYNIFKKKGYKALLMPAGMRGHYHAVNLAGGGIRMSIHPKIQRMILNSGTEMTEQMNTPVNRTTIANLKKLDEFIRAYEPDGMKPEEFITYGVTQKTLASFTDAWAVISEFRL